MPTFFEQPDAQARIQLLTLRMIRIKEAVTNGLITEAQLESIAKLSTADMADIKPQEEAKENEQDPKSVLLTLLTTDLPEGVIHAESFVESLKKFNLDQGDYFELSSFAINDKQSLALTLNDFAACYPLFIKHMTIERKRGEVENDIRLSMNKPAVKAACLDWIARRPARIFYDRAQAAHAGLFELFLDGQLKGDAWLSDIDIQRAFKIFDLESTSPHVVRFNAADMGMVLHFERQKHEKDDPKEPYVIPLIVNLGSNDHQSLDSKGIHWTHLLVSVDPTKVPTEINVNYKDELLLPEKRKDDLRKTIVKALEYYDDSSPDKIYSAFRYAQDPIITIEGSGEQREGYTCGYRALKGLIRDLIDGNALLSNELYQTFIACEDVNSMRDLVHKQLLENQIISDKTYNDLAAMYGVECFVEADPGQYKLNPDLIKGQLLQYSAKKTRVSEHAAPQKMDAAKLKAIVARQNKLLDIRNSDLVHGIKNYSQTELNIDLKQLPEEDKLLVLQAIFEALRENQTITSVQFDGAEGIEKDLLHDHIDTLPTSLKLSSMDSDLNTYLLLITARNQLLKDATHASRLARDPWEQLFESKLFNLPTKPTECFDFTEQGMDALGEVGFRKFLQFIADTKQQLAQMPVPFQTCHAGPITYLKVLKEQLASSEYVLFKQFNFTIDSMTDDVIGDMKEILSKGKIDTLKFTLSKDDLLNEDHLNDLIKFVRDNKITTVITFTPKSMKTNALLATLENAILANKRETLVEPESQALKKQESTIILGKIGRAIFLKEGVDSLESEVQVQQEQQQQQQVEQQAQTAVDNDDLPDEDEIIAESFSVYAGGDELLSRKDFKRELANHIQLRYPWLESGACWDLITGENADQFTYGIKKMTRSAALILIEHLHDVQYGLHPDNLPRGFSLQKDKDGAVVLNYTQVNPVLSPNESPLTIQFSQPLASNQWAGNVLQFMSVEQATALYSSIFGKIKGAKPTLEQCIDNFFFLKVEHPQIKTSDRSLILNAMIDGMAKANSEIIKNQIKTLFSNTLTDKNIQALSELLYEKGPDALSQLLKSLQTIKTQKGDESFACFKKCFIDPSNNLNELTNKASQRAMEQLRNFSKTQTTWWESLTAQHSSDIGYAKALQTESKPGNRWSDLAQLTDGFVYFCHQLEDKGLNLTTYCPLTNLADMRVGLDRLISTILPNALDLNEQFYGSLDGLQLDALGPFYASRYEGYKLVMPEMMLSLGSIERAADKGCAFKFDKKSLATNIKFANSKTDQKALFLRYVATYNHRAPKTMYLQIFDQLAKYFQKTDSLDSYGFILPIIACFSTGKRGKQVSEKDVNALLEVLNLNEPKQNEQSTGQLILSKWFTLVYHPIKPTICEITKISGLLLKADQPTESTETLKNLCSRLDMEADGYFDALSVLATNKQGIALDSIQVTLEDDLVQTYSASSKNPQEESKEESVSSSKKLPLKLWVETIKSLAVCSTVNVDKDSAPKKIKALYDQVEALFKKHGSQTTKDALELLAHIDVASENLPSLDCLTLLVQRIAAMENAPAYHELELTIKQALPEKCRIELKNVFSAPVESAGNLYAVISKHMRLIQEGLEPLKGQIDFYDDLRTAAGPGILMGNLKSLSEMSGFLNEAVQFAIKNGMMTVYEASLSDGIDRIGIMNTETKALLTKIMNNSFRHPVRETKDFTEFLNLYAAEQGSLEKILSNIKIIHDKWPDKLSAVMGVWNGNESLRAYSLETIAVVMKGFVDNFKQLPTETFGKFFRLENPNDELKEIIETIFEQQLDDDEKQLLCEVAIKFYQNSAAGSNKFIQDVIRLKDKNPELFSNKLELLLGSADLNDELRYVNEAIEQLTALNDPSLMTDVFHFFKNEHAPKLKTLLKDIKDKDTDTQKILITVILRAAQRGISDAKKAALDPDPKKVLVIPFEEPVMKQVIDHLKACTPADLKKYDALYKSPLHPNLVKLKEWFVEGKTSDELTSEYDQNPWPTKPRDFDTKKLGYYLDKLRDMNHDRPLLLSQRQELQRWFLYINIIGDELPIPVNSLANSPEKVIKYMSHDEISGLLSHYRSVLGNPKTSKAIRVKSQLEALALMREVMYRVSGKWPRPTQMLYALSVMQGGNNDVIAQLQTGEGKSMIAAIAGGMSHLLGNTVDICSSNLALASEGHEESKFFFDYLGVPTHLIHSGSKAEDYQEGAIHYSSMSEMALYRPKVQLKGKVFPKDSALIVDEVDFSTLDDSTRSRSAVLLDKVSNPDESPYRWAYEALVEFVDSQKTPMSDEDLLKHAKKKLHDSASTEQKNQLKQLLTTPQIYDKRVETWLFAAAKTAELVKLSEVKFRVLTLSHKKDSTVSKACLLSGGRPNIPAEYSNTIQQFLHVRLNEIYKKQISEGKMPKFLVEAEKTYVTTLNSKILINMYKTKMGMSGTVGSSKEIKEQYAKYGFRFVDIPPFADSARQDLAPLLTNPKFLNDPDKEEADHINKIVKDRLKHLLSEKNGKASPSLIICANKAEGEKIHAALIAALTKDPKKYDGKYEIQQYYSSEKLTPELRNKDESDRKKDAAKNGMITISSVFDRGTDIDPEHAKGLSVVQTYVDTAPYSAEDLERAKRQKIGRSGRKGQYGETRLIIRRSEFAPVYTPKDLRRLPQTSEGLEQAIRDLNNYHNKKRVVDRELRETFDDVKHILYSNFMIYMDIINRSDGNIPKNDIQNKLLMYWSLVLERIDYEWEKLQHDSTVSSSDKLNAIATFASKQWATFCADGSDMKKMLAAWEKQNSLKMSWPEDDSLSAETVVTQVTRKHSNLKPYYVKDTQRKSGVDTTLSADAVYYDFMTLDKKETQQMIAARRKAIDSHLGECVTWLSTPAYQHQLKDKFNFQANNNFAKTEDLIGALLYLRYKAYREGNLVAYSQLHNKYKQLAKQVVWSAEPGLITQLQDAQQDHFNRLTKHRGKKEEEKGQYLQKMMVDYKRLLPTKSGTLKANAFGDWWKNVMKPRVNDWSHGYKNEWIFNYVSKDRNAVVSTLLTDLAPDDSTPQAILANISKARKQLFTDDNVHKRTLKDGINGRLFTYLDELETRVQAAMSPQQLDADVGRVFSDIKVVLERCQQRLQNPEVQKVINALGNDVTKNYQVISSFFKNIALKDNCEADFKKDDFKVMVDYCRAKAKHLDYYFAQCGEQSQVIKTPSAKTYRSLASAVSSFVGHIKNTDLYDDTLNFTDKSLSYRGATVQFERKIAPMDNWFFKQIHQEKSYISLLSLIEKHFVEQSSQEKRVDFKSIALDKSTKFADNGFQLMIKMVINGKQTDVNYEFNTITGTVSCDHSSLLSLDADAKEPVLSPAKTNEVAILEGELKAIKRNSLDKNPDSEPTDTQTPRLSRG
jgi:hypothetical protein